MLTDEIFSFDFLKASEVSQDIDIQDFSDYTVVDNFLENIDYLFDSLKKFPADNACDIMKEYYTNKEDSSFTKGCGKTQIIPIHYFEKYIFELYKILVNCEYIPQNANKNLLDPQFITSLSRRCFVTGNVLYENMIINKNSNKPQISPFKYVAVLFFEDNDEQGINLYDLKYEGKYYKNIEEIIDIKDNNLKKSIADTLNIKNSMSNKIEIFSPFDDEKSDLFIKRRSIDAKKNRLVIFKGNTFFTNNYNNLGEKYTLITCINEPETNQNETSNN